MSIRTAIFVFLYLIVSLMGFAVPAYAASPADEAALTPQQIFERANELYRSQKFAEAQSRYNRLASSGVRSSQVYFNLGNASAALGETGEAVLNYEKALRIDPHDRDVLENLKRVAPASADAPPLVLVRPFLWVLERLTLREWIGTFVTLYAAACLLGAVVLSRRVSSAATRRLRALAFMLASLALLMGLFALSAYNQEQTPFVVVMQPDAVARSGPGDRFSQLAVFPEGSKLRRLSFTDDPLWARVALPEGQSGFLPISSVQPI